MDTQKRNIYIGVGCEPQQNLAYHVLKYSIEKSFKSDDYLIKTFPLHEINIDTKISENIKSLQGTPFSFQRFYFSIWASKTIKNNDVCIYLDSDMLVLGNISDLVDTFIRQNQNISICDTRKYWKRKQQQAVMLFNHRGAKELSDKFNSFLNLEISYKDLMKRPEMKEFLPWFWNSQEELTGDTKLIHYTDMDYQPWLRRDNVNSGIWITYLRSFIQSEDGKNILDDEIQKGFVRPSLSELFLNPPNYPVTSTYYIMKDSLFIPPHRLKVLKSKRLRLFLSPILKIFLLASRLLKNNRVNKI